jgi:hypothetical protein
VALEGAGGGLIFNAVRARQEVGMPLELRTHSHERGSMMMVTQQIVDYHSSYLSHFCVQLHPEIGNMVTWTHVTS